MSRYYYSVYGPLIKQFIDAKRTFGYKYAMVEQECARFDRFAYDNDENDIGISKGLATQWCAKKPNESVKTRRNRVQIIRVFSAYLCSVGYQSYVPQMPRAKSTFIPYIFSRDEIENIFLTSNCLQPAENSPNSSVFAIPCLFRLLYGTGIRINEALRLSCQDVNLMDKYLVLHDNKNGKDRMVPISNSLTIVCEEYLKHSQQYRTNYDSRRFFIKPNGKPFGSEAAYKWFRKLIYEAGISYQGRGIGPRLHDLRHTFSVHTLASMAEDGLDMYYSLPILSTYLGHQSVTSTDKYVRLTAEMFPLVLHKTNELYPYLFPDIYKTINL